jgi:hypothetical protein
MKDVGGLLYHDTLVMFPSGLFSILNEVMRTAGGAAVAFLKTFSAFC